MVVGFLEEEGLRKLRKGGIHIAFLVGVWVFW